MYVIMLKRSGVLKCTIKESFCKSSHILLVCNYKLEMLKSLITCGTKPSRRVNDANFVRHWYRYTFRRSLFFSKAFQGRLGHVLTAGKSALSV